MIMQQNIRHFQTKRDELDNRPCTKSDPLLLKHSHCMIAQAGRQAKHFQVLYSNRYYFSYNLHKRPDNIKHLCIGIKAYPRLATCI